MIVTPDKLASLRHKHSSQQIVLGSGVFDLLHPGHLEYLSSLRAYGDVIVVMVKPDARVRTFKDTSRPVMSQQDRAALVDALKGIDYVFIGPWDGATDANSDTLYDYVLAELKPDVFASTNPVWQKLKGRVPRVVINPRVTDYSTTNLIARIKSL